MESIWKKDERGARYQSLSEPISKEIIVVGGGIAGYLAAFWLAEAGHDVALLEAEHLFSGTTGRTTAHLDALQTLLYSKLIKRSYNKAMLYYESQKEAIDEYEVLIKKYDIECEFKRQDSYIVTKEYDCKLMKEAKALIEMGAPTSVWKNHPELKGDAAIMVPSMAMFDPLLFLRGLPVHFDIYENTRVTSADFKRKIIYIGNIPISAEKIVFATNFPIVNFPGLYFLRMYKSTSYAVAADNAPDLGGIYQSVSESGTTLRNYKSSVIVGGLDHRTGRLDDTAKYKKLMEEAKAISLGGEITNMWSSNDCITFDEIPFVGNYGRRTKDIYVITGFNKYGMANALTSAKLICNYVDEKPDRYRTLFRPQRKTCLLNFLRNFLCVAKSLIILPLLPSFKSSKMLKNGEGGIVMYRWRKRAVYRDENGKLHICRAYCPHLRCQLTFNQIEKTWDCPCHGSRFDIDGNILTAPAVKKLKSYY